MKENLTYRLIETADEMQRTLEHIDKVVSEQKELVELVKSSEKAKQFEGFTTSLEADIDNTVAQRAQLEQRHELLVEVIDACQADERIASVVSTLCEAFGIFQVAEQPEQVEPEETGKIIEFQKKD